MPLSERRGPGEPTDLSPSEREAARVLGPGMSRRGFGVGLVGASGLLLSGCRQCFSPFAPRSESSRKNGPRTFTVRANVDPSHYRALVDMLDDPSFNPFETPGAGVHFARLFTTEHRYLYLMVIYDEYEDAIAFLHRNARGIDRVFENCTKYPGATNKEQLDAFVRSSLLCVELWYRAYDESQQEIRDALALRDSFLVFLRGIEGLPEAELRRRYAGFVANPNIVNHDLEPDNDIDSSETEGGTPVQLVPLVQQGPVQGPVQGPPRALAKRSHINEPDRVSPFTLLARVNPRKLITLSRRLRLGTYAVIDLGLRPLKNLPTLHFARVSIIGDQMLFASVYDGDFMQYVEDFGTRIADEIDKVFGLCVGYPIAGSRDVFAFRDFLRANEVVTRDFAGTYLDRSLLQIRSSLALSRAFARFSKRVGPEHRKLAPRLQRFLHDNQGLLT